MMAKQARNSDRRDSVSDLLRDALTGDIAVEMNGARKERANVRERLGQTCSCLSYYWTSIDTQRRLDNGSDGTKLTRVSFELQSFFFP
jgi:hypothetical protein